MSLSVGNNVSSPVPQQNVPANRDVPSQATQRSSGDQDRVRDGDAKSGDAVTLSPSRNSTQPAAEGRIQNAVVAAQAASRAQTQMIEQSGAAIMSQAHATPQAVLAALRA